MGIGTTLARLRKAMAARRDRTFNEPDASAAPGLRRPGRGPTYLDWDLARDATPSSLRSPESRDDRDDELNR